MTVGAWRMEVGRGRNAPHDARAVQTRESRHERVGEEGRLQTAVPVAPLERRSPKAWLSPQRVRATGGDPCVEGCAKLQTFTGVPSSLPTLSLHSPTPSSKPATGRNTGLFSFTSLSSRNPYCNHVCAAPTSAVRTACSPTCRWDSPWRFVGSRGPVGWQLSTTPTDAHGRKCTPSPPLRDLGLAMCTLCCAR